MRDAESIFSQSRVFLAYKLRFSAVKHLNVFGTLPFVLATSGCERPNAPISTRSSGRSHVRYRPCAGMIHVGARITVGV